MPMDYDDNDFHIIHNNNVHLLAGEGSSTVSPILRGPYALLKFEYDNSHLRFDSLVENEVFLGITGQEDNQWIEEYSRSNVLSEATSSEMLLKSVGQQEEGEAVTEEFDASSSLATIIMDPNSNNHDDGVIYAPDTTVTNKPQDSFSASTDCDKSHVTSATQSEDAKISGEKSEGKVDRVCDVVNEEEEADENLAVDLDKNETKNVEGSKWAEAEYNNSMKKKESSMDRLETCTYSHSDEKASVVEGHTSFEVSHGIGGECADPASPVGEVDGSMHGIGESHSLASSPVTGLVKPQQHIIEDDSTKSGILASSPEVSPDLQTTTVEETENSNGSIIRDVGANLTPDLLGGSTLNNEEDLAASDNNNTPKAMDTVDKVQVNDEIPSSEQHCLFVDEDVNSNEGGVIDSDSQKNVESTSSAFVMAQGSEGDMTILAEPVPAAVKPSSPDTWDGVHLDSRSVATNYAGAGAGSSEAASREPLSVVEKDASPDCAGKIIHQVAAGRQSALISEQAQEEEANTNANNVEAGGVQQDPKESLSGHYKAAPLSLAAVDMHQPSVDECNASRHDDDDDDCCVKLQSVSPSNTSNTEPGQSAKVTTHEMAKEGKLESVSPDKSFTFEVVSASADLGQPDPVGAIQACNLLLMNMEGSSTSCSSKKADEVPLVIPQTPSTATAIQVGAKGNAERKTGPKSAGKESAKKVKERRSGKVEKSSAQATAHHHHHHVIQFDELKPKEVASSITKPTGIPDLNNATYCIFQQQQQPSFTDNQQVQLRAQILVYGSLISGTPPEEPHMVAVFGQSDGGRKTWEAAWHACLESERVRNPNNPVSGTPMQSLSDAGSKQSSKVVSSSSSNKATPPAVSPLIPLSTPLWNISTPSASASGGMPTSAALLDYHRQQSFSPPLNPYHHHHHHQTPPVPVQNHNSPWLSQGPFAAAAAGQRLASSPVSTFNAATCFSALPMAITEAVKLTPVKLSGIKHAYSIPLLHTAPSLLSDDAKKGTDSKSRKRKKATSTSSVADPSQALTVPRTNGHNHHILLGNPTNLIIAPVVSNTSIFSTSVTTSVSMTSKTSSSPGTATGRFLSIVNPNETLNKSEDECKEEDAGPRTWHPSSHSKSIKKRKRVTNTSSINQNQTSIPRQAPLASTSLPQAHTHTRTDSVTACSSFPTSSVGMYQNKETLSKVEESKLQAENAALLAAAEVGHCQDVWSRKKPCGGVVSDAEAKLMSTAISIAAAAASVAKMAAAAAKIASDVAQQARLMADEVLFLSTKTQNIDQTKSAAPAASIIKSKSNNPNSIISVAREAARRRIEAASTASKHAENLDAIVKAAELAAEAVSQAGKIVAMPIPMGDSSSAALRKLVEAGPEGGYTYWRTSALAYEVYSNSDKQKNAPAPNVEEIESLKQGLAENQQVMVDGNDKETKGIPTRAHRAAAAAGVALETEETSDAGGSGSLDKSVSVSGAWEQHNIKEGCLVEVYKEDGKYKGAWVAANVLSLKDEKALVCYTEIQSPDEGGSDSEKVVKEWVSLEVEGSKVPGIRIAHPIMMMMMTSSMRFQGGPKKRRRTAVTDYAWSSGDRVDVWMNNCWRMGIVMESKNKIGVTSLSVQFPGEGEGESGCVVGSWNVRPSLVWKDGKWMEWWSSLKGVDSESETRKEKRMKVGSPGVKDKSAKHMEVGRGEETATLGDVGREEEDVRIRMKSGAKVIFGVPKPAGKKQKFMDVSKHYYYEETKSRHRKPPVPSFRSLGHKDKNLVLLSSKPTTGSGDMEDKSVSEVENQNQKQKQMESGGLDAPFPKKALSFTPNSNTKKELSKGKPNVKDIIIEESTEPPRRSNRKIQPTSRLLEGIQSSLTISKIPPSFSHTTSSTSSSHRSHGNKVTSTSKENANHG